LSLNNQKLLILFIKLKIVHIIHIEMNIYQEDNIVHRFLHLLLQEKYKLISLQEMY
jgi:hypothetical protein